MTEQVSGEGVMNAILMHVSWKMTHDADQTLWCGVESIWTSNFDLSSFRTSARAEEMGLRPLAHTSCGAVRTKRVFLQQNSIEVMLWHKPAYTSVGWDSKTTYWSSTNAGSWSWSWCILLGKKGSGLVFLWPPLLVHSTYTILTRFSLLLIRWCFASQKYPKKQLMKLL